MNTAVTSFIAIQACNKSDSLIIEAPAIVWGLLKTEKIEVFQEQKELNSSDFIGKMRTSHGIGF